MISILLDKLMLTRLTPAEIPSDDLIVDNHTTTRTMKMTQIEDRESFTGKKNRYVEILYLLNYKRGVVVMVRYQVVS
jgi:hypothetical protein